MPQNMKSIPDYLDTNFLEDQENLLVATEILCFLQSVAIVVLKDEEFIPMLKSIIEKDTITNKLFLTNLSVCIDNLKDILKGGQNERSN